MPTVPVSFETEIVDEVERVLALDDDARIDGLTAIAEDLFAAAYDEQTDDDSPLEPEDFARFTAQLASALNETTGDSSVALVAGWIATAAWNAATLAAAPPGVELTWRTQRDDDVRDIHVPLDGATASAGGTFLVGGSRLRYPGEPVGPPEVWINCRCWLDASLTAAVSEEPWGKFSAADYTIEQWRRACLIKMPDGDPESKSTYKLPVRTPSGALSRAGVHAAWAALRGARGGVDAPEAQKSAARSKLRAAYKQFGEDPPEGMAADGELTDQSVTAAPVPTPANTHDAPGWITHPKVTQRLRDYWTKGEGALKIRWGTPGDLTRCEKHLRKYVGPMWSWGTCNNLHHVVFGFFNPDSGRKGSADIETSNRVAEAFAAIPEEEAMLPPRSLFENPHLDAPTPMMVRAAGEFLEYVGHLATWEQCHVGFGEVEGQCVTAPRSQTNYAYFRTGEVETDQGPVAVGHVTAATGHAEKYDGPQETIAHYDNTGTVAADVAAGEDLFGIWGHGIVRPGATEQQIYALRAGAPSGDWRRIGGNLELVGALIVNVPGFPIPRPELALSASGAPVSLTAVGILVPDAHADIAEKVVAALDRLTQKRERGKRAEAIVASARALRVERLVREIEELV